MVARAVAPVVAPSSRYHAERPYFTLSIYRVHPLEGYAGFFPTRFFLWTRFVDTLIRRAATHSPHLWDGLRPSDSWVEEDRRSALLFETKPSD
jgi:hypothetical protein